MSAIPMQMAAPRHLHQQSRVRSCRFGLLHLQGNAGNSRSLRYRIKHLTKQLREFHMMICEYEFSFQACLKREVSLACAAVQLLRRTGSWGRRQVSSRNRDAALDRTRSVS